MNYLPSNRPDAESRDRQALSFLFCALALLLILLFICIPIGLASSDTVPTSSAGDYNKAVASASPSDSDSITPGAESTSPISTATTVTARSQRDFDPPVPTHSYLPVTDSQTALISPDEIDAGHAILVNAATGKVIASRLPDERIYPASMTKVMTLIVACERLDSLDLTQTIVITQAMVDNAYLAGASQAGFSIGEAVNTLDLLYGIALPSGAEATAAIAEYLAGSEERFVGWMNDAAGRLGLIGTHFINTSGLHDPDHYSTVREVAAMMAYAMELPLCRQLLSAKTYTTASTVQHPSGITFYSTTFSRMSSTVFGMVEVIAGKTGYTDEARFCLVTYATRPDGSGYLLVTAKGSTKYTPVTDAAALYRKYIS